MTVDGIDISHHQATTPSLAGLEFLFARATYGTSPDRLYAQHIANARRAGLVVGAYHFGRNQPVADQVDAFLRAAGDVDLYALDLESDGGSPAMTASQARAFIAAMHARGRRVGLYHSESGFADIGQAWHWVANWSRPPARLWTFWQYRGSPLDLDRFNGSRDELWRLVGRPAAPALRARVPAGSFFAYVVVAGVVRRRELRRTGGFSATCTAPNVYPWPTGPDHRVGLVRLTSGSRRGVYISAKYVGGAP